MRVKISTLVVLAVVYVFQVTQATPVKFITPEELRKLKGAIVEAKKAKRSSLIEVDTIKNDTEKRIDAALKPINEQVESVRHDVKRAKKEAEEQGVDITDCVDDVRRALHHLNIDMVRKCGNPKQIKKAGDKVSDIENQISVLYNARQKCFKKEDNNDACIEKIITDAREKIKQFQGEISNILRKIVVAEQDECIAREAEKLKSQVDEAVQNWNKCLEASLST